MLRVFGFLSPKNLEINYIYMKKILSHSVGYIFIQTAVSFVMSSLYFFIFYLFQYMYMCEHTTACTEVTRRCVRVFSLLPPYGSWESNWGCQVFLHLQSSRFFHPLRHLTSPRCFFIREFPYATCWFYFVGDWNPIHHLPVSTCFLQQCQSFSCYTKVSDPSGVEFLQGKR